MKDPFKQQLRLKKPCGNCPFRTEGAIDLRPGRLDGIVEDLLANDHKAFYCHKTLKNSQDDGEGHGHYIPSGDEAMCAGAAAFLMKRGRPTVSMRFAFLLGIAAPADWDAAKKLIIE